MLNVDSGPHLPFCLGSVNSVICFNTSFSVICNRLHCDCIVYLQCSDIRSDGEIYNFISVGSCGNVIHSYVDRLSLDNRKGILVIVSWS